MKRVFVSLLVLLFLSAFSAPSFAQRVSKTAESDTAKTDEKPEAAPPKRPAGPMFPMQEVFEKAKNDEGKVDIAKAAALLSEGFGKSLTEADADKDGILSKDELKAVPFLSPPGFGGNRGPGGPFGAARTEDGKIDLSKLPEQMPEEVRKNITDADADGDGFLSQEEQGKLPFMSRQPMGPFGAARTEDGKIDLSKLPEQMPEEVRKNITDADADGDGFLSQEEQGKLPFMNRQPMGPFGAARTEDGKIDLSKLPEQMPEDVRNNLTEADADGDGFLSQEEQEGLPFMGPPPADGRGDRGPRSGDRNRNGRRDRQNRRGDAPPRMNPGPGGPMAGFFEAMNSARTDDGGINIQKLVEGMNSAQTKFLQSADKDGDGLLSEKEMKAMTPPRGPRPEGRPAGRGPERRNSRARNN